MSFEKDGYTWIQNESLADLIKPERIRQVKLDIIKRQETNKIRTKARVLPNSSVMNMFVPTVLFKTLKHNRRNVYVERCRMG